MTAIETVADVRRLVEPYWHSSFPWHKQQRIALGAHTDIIMVLGGNQSGKSTTLAGMVGRLARREGPIYQRLRNPGRLKIWVAPLTLEKWRSNWETRLLSDVFAGMGAAYTQSPHPVITWADELGGGEVWGKSQDQGFMAFESDVVHFIALDEEPEDVRLYGSCMQRFATTGGCLALGFTPLLGMDWTYTKLYEPIAKPEFLRGDRVWKSSPKGDTTGVTVIQMGMADNPAAAAHAAKIAHDPVMPEQEKRTRLYGEYGFVEGLVFPQFQDWKRYFLPSLPPGKPYSWVLTMDPNKRHGGLLTALDHEGNRYYVAEHFETGKPDSYHAACYLRLLAMYGAQNAALFADPGGAGAQSILNLGERGVFAGPVPKDAGSVKASIDLIQRESWIDPNHPHPTNMNDKGTRSFGAPHTYFCGTLWTSSWEGHQNDSRLVWELQRYRWKPNVAFQPIKQDDDLVDCMRYLELVRPFAPAEPDLTKQRLKETLDPLSYREAQDYDKVVSRHVAAKYRKERVDRDLDFADPEIDLT